MRKIKVVQIGLAHDHAPVFAEIKRMSEYFEILGYVLPESDKEYMKRVGSYDHMMSLVSGYPEYSVEEALSLDGLDAVIVETEELTSVKYAQMAADKGLHIHLDKPGSADHDEFVRLAETQRKNGKTLHLGYMYRFNPAVVRTLERIKNGEIGDVVCVEAHMDCKHVPSKRQWLEQFPGGMMFFLGCHLVDLVYMIMGEPEEIVPLNASTGSDGVTSQDYGFALFKYKTGVSFAKSSANENGGFMRRQLIVSGTKGTVRIMPIEEFCEGGQKTEWYEVGECADWSQKGEFFESEPYGRYDAMFRDFAEIVCGEHENSFDYDYEINLHRLVLAACGVKEN